MSRKVALVTGGATGIGMATAEKLVRSGYHVVISGRRKDKGKKAEKQLNELASSLNSSAQAMFIRNDVSDEEQVGEMVAAIINKFGSLDVAVNNAGIASDMGTIGDADANAFKQMLDINVLGLFYCMQAQIRQMKKQGFGAVVNVASIAGLNGIPFAGTYAATKHAVVGLTKSAALDHISDGIRINAVAPGVVKTEMVTGAIESGHFDEETNANMHPINRISTPDEIANGICWLLSEEASFTVGHILSIDGGYQAK